MANIPVQSVIDSIKIPYGKLGSFIVNPNAIELGSQADLQAKLSLVFGDIPELGASMTSSLTALTTDLTTYTNEKLSKITTELPMMQSMTASVAAANVQMSRMNEVLGIQPSPEKKDDPINTAFPDTHVPDPDDPSKPIKCPSVADAFKGLSEGVKTACAAVQTKIAEVFNTINGALKTALASVIGAFTTGAEFVKNLLATTKEALAPLGATITEMYNTVADVAADIKTKLTGAIAGATEAATKFAGVIAKEAEDIKTAIATMTGLNFLSMFSSANECVREMMGKVSNPAIATPNIKTVTSASPTEIDTPASNAVTVVAGGGPLENRMIVSEYKTPVPTDIPNPYSDEEIAGTLTSAMASYFDNMQAIKRQAAEWVVTNIEDWKELATVRYQEKQVAAGATTANPEGTSTDKAAIAAWNAVYKQYIPKRDYYNKNFVPQMAQAKFVYQAVGTEFKLRKQFGKTPYTTMAARGIATPEARQTTFLDTGK